MRSSTPASAVIQPRLKDLQDMERMASDPYLLSVMCLIVDASRETGDAKPVAPSQTKNKAREPKVATPSSHNGLTPNVLTCGKAMQSEITIAKLVDKLTENGFKFVAAQPKVAVADVVRRYLNVNFTLTKQGVGNEPSIYKWKDQDADDLLG